LFRFCLRKWEKDVEGEGERKGSIRGEKKWGGGGMLNMEQGGNPKREQGGGGGVDSLDGQEISEEETMRSKNGKRGKKEK